MFGFDAVMDLGKPETQGLGPGATSVLWVIIIAALVLAVVIIVGVLRIISIKRSQSDVDFVQAQDVVDDVTSVESNNVADDSDMVITDVKDL